HDLYSDIFPNFFNFPFVEPVLIYRNGVTEHWRSEEFFFKILPERFALWAKKHPSRLNAALRQYRAEVKKIKALKRSSRVLSDPKRILSALKKMHYSMRRAAPGMLPVSWAGRWSEVYAGSRQLFTTAFLRKMDALRKIDTMTEDGAALTLRYLTALARATSISKNALSMGLIEELGSLVEEGDFNIKEIKKREKGYAYLYGSIVPLPQLARELRKRKIKLEEARSVKKTITGRAAFPGTVQGIARIVMRRSQFSSFKKGEIVIAPMTTPAYLPVVRRASAIVTDEGGLTCHAAIIARELGVPCVIGTKIATRAFKDGDRVEVDAEKGVVRKI
ncbi:MAG: PEP-utilizing enzyme, partial [Patescibacteria group bacterium]